jgi:hypothetical protein
MQYLNDDMDELWRKAADEYPLNTTSADWNQVAAKMGIEPLRKRNARRYLPLLLLLLLPWVCIQYRQHKEGEDARTAATPKGRMQQAPGQATPDASHVDGARQSAKKTISATEAGQTAAASKETISFPVNTTTTDPSGTPVLTSKRTSSASVQIRSTDTRKTARTHVAPFTFISASSSVRSRSKAVADHENIAKGRRSAGSGTAGQEEPTPLGTVVTPDATATVPPVRDEQPPVAARDTTTVGKTAVALPPVVDSPALTKPAQQKAKTATPKGLYAGILGGMGVTSVKGQRVEKAGTDIGIVLGYTAGKHWAFEAGLLWSRKHYYSRGDLVKAEVYTPRYYVLSDVSGDCRMIEIPVSVQYHFAYGRHGNWFASAGLSSYLMQREDYDYTYKNNSYNTEYPVYSTYNNATKDWISQLQLSAGYRWSLPRRFALRAEPYVQLPLKVAGYGRLPLTSAGLRIAITKSIF